ncbi:MAG: hypothetical protein V8Q12_04350 [Agathobacter rectalis]
MSLLRSWRVLEASGICCRKSENHESDIMKRCHTNNACGYVVLKLFWMYILGVMCGEKLAAIIK